MKCPWLIRNTQTVIPQAPIFVEHEYDLTDTQKDKIVVYNNTTLTLDTPVFMDCLGEDCAAWQEGKCRRVGTTA